jgi:SAM-dependent methyltransferase
MDDKPFIQAMLKHLPPSAATLRLLDVGGRARAIFAEQRGDLDITAGIPDSQFSPDSMDSIVAYDYPFDSDFFENALAILRPGGRLIGVNPRGEIEQAWVARLEKPGFTRILVEAALESGGVLIRGEKPHTEPHTIDRIRQVADRDNAAAFQGRYVHLLIRQTPNKPVWALKEGEKIVWQAVALDGDEQYPILLAFSSLPKAVAFMQPAVMSGFIRDINKVAKFSQETVQNWSLLANPTLNLLAGKTITFVPIDPNSAETPDE